MSSEHVEYTLEGIEELPPELDRRVREMIAEADREGDDAQVIFAWRSLPLEAVRRAAEVIGIPWQAYIKQAAFRQAMADLAAAGAPVPDSLAGLAPPGSSRGAKPELAPADGGPVHRGRTEQATAPPGQAS